MRLDSVLFALAVWLGVFPAVAQERVACAPGENVELTCGSYACRVDPASATGHSCGKCSYSQDIDDDEGSLQCGGGNCTPEGQCQRPMAARVEPIRPSFHLLVAALSLPVGDAEGSDLKPIVGAGYVYELALQQTAPRALDDGGFSTRTTPRWYLHVGGELAMAGPAQNAFAALGAAYYLPLHPITTLGIQALYQRTGSSIWKLADAQHNSDRLGPALELGILHNVFFRGAWLLPLSGPNREQALIFSILYLRDLLSDVLPGGSGRALSNAL